MKRGSYKAKDPTAKPKPHKARRIVPLTSQALLECEAVLNNDNSPNIVTALAKALAKEKNKKPKPKDFSLAPASMNKPAHYTLARENIMCVYTLLCPNEVSVEDLRNHLEEVSYQSGFSHSLDTQRTLFFECFDALEAGLKGTWFRKD